MVSLMSYADSENELNFRIRIGKRCSCTARTCLNMPQISECTQHLDNTISDTVLVTPHHTPTLHSPPHHISTLHSPPHSTHPHTPLTSTPHHTPTLHSPPHSTHPHTPLTSTPHSPPPCFSHCTLLCVTSREKGW